MMAAPIEDLPPSGKMVLRELEHANAPLSRRELEERTRLAYSTVCDGLDAMSDEQMLSVTASPGDPVRFGLSAAFRDSE